MLRTDLYLVGKHHIMNAVLDLYNNDVKEAQQQVLDCGCGRGTYAYKLESRPYVGVDVNSSSIRLAHDIHPDRMFVVADAKRLPFGDRFFDCVICSEVLEHVSNDGAVIDELARVTKASGRLIVSFPNVDCRNFLVGWQRSLIDTRVGHVRLGYRLSDILRLLVKSGFRAKEKKFDCGPVTAVVEGLIITLGSVFGYDPSNLNQLLEENKSLLVRAILRIYEQLFSFIILVTYLDRLLPKKYRSNIVLLAEK